MRIFLLFLTLIVAGNTCVLSQNTLNGTVSNQLNQPLDGAHIHIWQLHGVSMPNGYYEVHGIANGSQRVVISFIGYKSLDTIIDITGNVTINALLKPETQQLDEVVLTGNTAVSKNTTHQQRLKAETIEKYSSESLGDALKEIAGVSALKTGNVIVKPVINGLHSSRVPVISNNVRLEDQQWGTEHAPNLDINAAGRVTVIKGANALQYGGDAIGGIVLVEPASILKDTLYGKTLMSLASNGRGGTITSSLHRGAERGWAWNAAGTFKYFGDRQTPDYVLSNTGNREANFAGDAKYLGSDYDISAFYSFYNATIGIARATHIGSVSDLVTAINSGQPGYIEPSTYGIAAPRQEVQHHLAKANFNKQLDESSSLSVQYAFQLNSRKEYDIRRGDYIDKPALDLTLATHSAQADWKKEASSYLIKAGLSGSLQHNDASPD
ncbi:MAG: TonB-dependent receptor, partial [Flavobacterium sp.]